MSSRKLRREPIALQAVPLLALPQTHRVSRRDVDRILHLVQIKSNIQKDPVIRSGSDEMDVSRLERPQHLLLERLFDGSPG